MQLTSYPNSTSVDAGISFPRLESWNTLTKVATIAAEVNKKRVLCRISSRILRDKFGSSEEDSMKSIVQHRTEIQEAARKLIECGGYEDDGSILIRAGDL